MSANVGDLGRSPADAADASSVDVADGTPSDDARTSEDATVDGPETTSLDGETASSDAGCGVGFPQAGSFVDVAPIQGPTPQLAGGAIVAGMYKLTAMRIYFGPGSGTMQVRETLRVRGSSTAGAFDVLTEARAATGTFKPYAAHGETSTWDVGAGPSIFVSPECPTGGFEVANRFDMTGDQLTLFDDSTAIERVYRRIP